MARTLLLVSLEKSAINDYRQGFAAEGFGVDSAYRADHAEAMAAMHNYDAIVIFSPSAASIRALVSRLWEPDWLHPVVVCVTTVEAQDEIELLGLGAAICRPCGIGFRELLAQTRALLDRVQGYPQHFRVDDLGIDPVTRRASRQGVPLALRPTEFDLLLRLAESKGELVHRESLIEALWPNGGGSANLLAAHVRNLRGALEKRRQRRLLHTVRNLGYVLCEPPQRQRQRHAPAMYQWLGFPDARPAHR